MRIPPGVSRATLPAVRAAWGGWLLAAPVSVLGTGRAGPSPGSARVVLRLLGARHLGQAALTWLRPTRAVVTAGTAADALHAASGAVLALASSRWRRAAAADCVIASAFALADLATRNDLPARPRSTRAGRRALARTADAGRGQQPASPA